MLRALDQLRDLDTVFVPLTSVDRFVDEILDRLRSDVPAISGRTQKSPGPADESVEWRGCSAAPASCSSARTCRCTAGWQSARHAKTSPFPYRPRESDAGARKGEALEAYRRVFYGALYNASSMGCGPTGPRGGSWAGTTSRGAADRACPFRPPAG